MPIIFIHGIGIGLQTYMSFFHQLSRTATADDIGIIALEIMPISSRFTSPLPRKEVIVAEIQQILRHHGWSADNQKCVVMSQSYGSVIATYLLRECPDLVGPLLFVDPVAFSFHPPQVGWNFLRRKPTTASQLQLYYFASTDPDIARAMTRSFVWQENSLWREDVEDDREGRQCTVVLSEKDIIIDTLTLGRYLTRRPQKGDQPKWYQERKEHDDGWKTREWTGRGLEVVWYPGLNHAEVYDSYDSRKNLIDILQRYSTS
jgi:pimeloyl-ACP methyl ester carboxylesterase